MNAIGNLNKSEINILNKKCMSTLFSGAYIPVKQKGKDVKSIIWA